MTMVILGRRVSVNLDGRQCFLDSSMAFSKSGETVRTGEGAASAVLAAVTTAIIDKKQSPLRGRRSEAGVIAGKGHPAVLAAAGKHFDFVRKGGYRCIGDDVDLGYLLGPHQFLHEILHRHVAAVDVVDVDFLLLGLLRKCFFDTFF